MEHSIKVAFHPLLAWVQRHSVSLLRVVAIIVVLGLTVALGVTCHGYIGPPG